MKNSKFRLETICALMLTGLLSLQAFADVKSTNPKDPYSLRYSRVAPGKTVLELCGPKGCHVLGPVQLVLDQHEIESLKNREKFQYYVNEAANPVLVFVMPAASVYKGFAIAKVTLRVAEKYVPYVANKIFEKFGKEMTVKALGGVLGVANGAESVSMYGRIADEFVNPDTNKAALEALSDRAQRGEEVHVDFSIEQLARHLEADLVEKQRAKEQVEEEKDNPQFSWPI